MWGFVGLCFVVLCVASDKYRVNGAFNTELFIYGLIAVLVVGAVLGRK